MASNAVAAEDAVNANCMVMDLRISPNYDQDGSIVALCNTSYSTNRTVTENELLPCRFHKQWQQLDASSTLNAGHTANAQASAFDIAPNFDGNDGGDIAVGLAGQPTTMLRALDRPRLCRC